MTKTIGYVLRKFPVLSETFVLEEMLALESKGIPIHVLSLARPSDPRYHGSLGGLKAPITYVPEITDLTALLRANRAAAKRHRKRYFRTLGYALSKMDTTLFWRFLQGGYIAMEARRRRISHLHAHFATRATSAAFMASQIANIPYSFTAHAYDIFTNGISEHVLARKIEKARFVVTISDYNKAYLEEIAPSDGEKIVRVYNGIDLCRFAPSETSPPDPFTIITVARLVEKKGLPILIEASALLRDRGVDFRCWIIGKGRLRAHLQELIERHGLQERVLLLGAQTSDEVLGRFKAAHLCVLPCIVGSDGNRDGLPVSIVEALACGIPVVSSPVTAIPEAVADGKNGLLVPEGDAQSLAAAIEAMIRDPQLYRRLQANARPSVAERFDIRQTAVGLAQLFAQE